MRIIFLIIFITGSFHCFAQENIRDIRTGSWQSFAYRITAAEAEQYMKWDSIPLNRFEEAQPAMVFKRERISEDELPIGNYVLLFVSENKIEASLINRSSLRLATINNRRTLQLDVRNKQGEPVEDAKVYVKDKAVMMNPHSKTFWASSAKPAGTLVKVYTPTDTFYTSIREKTDSYKPISEQRRLNYHGTKIYKVLNWVPSKLKLLFNSYDRKRNNSNAGAKGYMVFSQPKYRLADTLKYKGYLVDKKWRQYKKKVDVYLNYYDKGRNVSQYLQSLKPVTPGAYMGELSFADTLPQGIRYYLMFKTSGGKKLLSREFRIEDYVLDEIGSYNLRSEKETYYRSDSLRFYASAKDANGLNILDANAELILTSGDISATFRDTVFVADTLFRKKIKLEAEGDTKFVVPANLLPDGNYLIEATVRFINSSNEVQEKVKGVDYKYFSKEINVTSKRDSVYADYLENGVSVPADGFVEAEDKTPVHYPAVMKLNNMAEDYFFSLKKDEDIKKLFSPDNYFPWLSRISEGDTLGFILNNPNKVLVYYTVFNGLEVIATGKQNDELIVWKKLMKDNRQSYKLRWQYIWNGEEQQKEEQIGLLYKMLKLDINAKEKIFPGQKDSISIHVSDYKGVPATGVNLTAVSYNNQFSSEIKVADPPYLVKYKTRHYLERVEFTEDITSFLSKTYPLGDYKKWLPKFHLDTMTYYKMLFPENGFYDALTVISDFVPQVSVNIVKNGVPQEIYLLSVNRNFEYYNAATDTTQYAFHAFPGLVQFRIRTKNSLIEIDSIYIQPNYKHDISFDLDHLPGRSTITKMPSYWTNEEIMLLEKSIWQMSDTKDEGIGYIWQADKMVKLRNNSRHRVGPFMQDSMYFFRPSKFDIAFRFEPGYEYNLSRQVARLEKNPLFPKSEKPYYLPEIRHTALKYGDTLLLPPAIHYEMAEQSVKPDILSGNTFDYYYEQHIPGTGSLLIRAPKDTIIKYVILQPLDDTMKAIVMPLGYTKKVYNLPAAKYDLLLVNSNYRTAVYNNVSIQENGTLVADFNHAAFLPGNVLVEQLMQEATAKAALRNAGKKQENVPDLKQAGTLPAALLFEKDAGATVTIQVRDDKTQVAIPLAMISIKGYRFGTVTDQSGIGGIRHLRSGSYLFVASSVGYTSKEILVEVGQKDISLQVSLSISKSELQEVVVTALGIQRQKKDLAYATVSVTGNLFAEGGLQGKVSGLMITSSNYGVIEEQTINLRGIRSLTGNNEPLLLVDGIITPLSELSKINPADIVDVTVLKGTSAVAIYGPDAANGAIIVTTKAKTERKVFKDYATWQPNLITDKNGNASFETTYPDNITAWKTFVLAMDKKMRIGKTSMLTQSYKPIVAQLSLPLFLLEGDSAYVTGRSSNYTADKYSVKSIFRSGDNLLSETQQDLLPNAANTKQQLITSPAEDTLTISFHLETSTGFKDAEERRLPILKKGIEETVGNFWVLQNDTIVSFSTLPGNTCVTIFAQNNTLDMLMDELEHLKDYPYACMEQTASKYTGLALKKKICEVLNKDFTEQKIADKLLVKIQKTQLFNGGWPWWENGKANLYVTNYITHALLAHRDNPLVETNIRNAFLYLQNQLPLLKGEELLSALFTLSEGDHEMNYNSWLQNIKADSLNQHGQWQLVRICQRQKLEYQDLLKKLVAKKVTSMTGAIHWGRQNYLWYGNDVATTVLAFNVVKQEAAYRELLPAIIRYFLEARSNGYWANTVESATIVDAILPEILKGQKDFITPAGISISGDTNVVITKFPFELKARNISWKNIRFTKSGGGMVYLTAYQKIFKPAPEPVTDNFIINTFFQKNNRQVSEIKAGEKIILEVEVNALKDAEYVMLEVPIPAGCIYSEKSNGNRYGYSEASKDKVTLFLEYLETGKHIVEIELSPRYNGTYTLNPAKAELMYYPTFFGRNEMKKMSIVP